MASINLDEIIGKSLTPVVDEDDLGHPSVPEGYVSVVPEGYAWCEDCQALTPHTKATFSLVCYVCGHRKYSDGCPVCKATNNLDDMERERVEELHRPGCHLAYEDFHASRGHAIMRDFYESWKATPNPLPGVPDSVWRGRLYDRWQAEYNRECGCERVTVYPSPQLLRFTRYPVFSLECMHAHEWQWTVRCPVCGCVYTETDTNC